MFGIGFGARTRKILIKEFSYEPRDFQNVILGDICKRAKKEGVCEYDAAILCMLCQMNALYSSDKKTKSFIIKHVKNVRRIYSNCSSEIGSIEATITGILRKHEMAELKS